MNRNDKTLETELQAAFVAGQHQRLARFAHWCASQTITEDASPAWFEALELARLRAEGACDGRAFSAQADRLLRTLPIAATVIGLKHGAPNAMCLLTLAAALDTGPLTAAIQAGRNHRSYERMVAQRRQPPAEPAEGPVVVNLASARPLTGQGAPMTLAEARCAERQLAAWRAM